MKTSGLEWVSPSVESELARTMSTLDVGSESRTTVMDVSPPASVVTRPLVPLIVRPAISSSLLIAATVASDRASYVASSDDASTEIE